MKLKLKEKGKENKKGRRQRKIEGVSIIKNKYGKKKEWIDGCKSLTLKLAFEHLTETSRVNFQNIYRKRNVDQVSDTKN